MAPKPTKPRTPGKDTPGVSLSMCSRPPTRESVPNAQPQSTKDERTGGLLDGSENESQSLAKLITNCSAATVTVKQYAGVSDKLDGLDLLRELRQAGAEAVAGKLERYERMLACQAISLDSLFHDLAQRAGNQGDVKKLEVFMRLALKAQSQARATIETLAAVKYPAPYIRQANIAHGHQQVNNGPIGARAEKTKTAPNELLEATDG